MTPDDLYGINWLGECDISPDGRRVAFVATKIDRESDTYKSAVWVVDTSGGEPRQFTAGAKRDSSPRWSPDGKWLAFVSERGDEKPQLYLMPADGGESRKLTSLALGAGVPAWSPDSRSLAFSAKTGAPPDPDPKKAKPYRRITTLKYRINGEGFTYDQRRHLFVVATAEGSEARQVTDGDWDDTQPAWSPDGRQLAFASARHDERDYDTLNDIWVVSAEGGEARRVTDTQGSCRAPSWSPDGRTIAYIGAPLSPANGRLRLAGAAGGNLRWADAAFDRETGAGGLPGAVAQPAWLPDGSILSVAQDRGSATPIAVKEGAATRWLRPGPYATGWYSVSADGTKVALTASTLSAPAEVRLLDITTGEERRLTSMNAGWIAEVEATPAERFVVPTAEGVEIDCWYMRPAGFEEGKRYPVLLNVHGGPFGQYGEAFFDEFQVYVGASYGVVFCNPRGGSGQTTEFARAVVGNMGGPDFHDVMRAFEAALEQMPWADRSRLGVMGGSYGGFMTSWIIGHDRRFAAACSERAVNDWFSMQGASDIGSYFNEMYLGEGASVEGDLEKLLSQSPLTYAKEIRTPVLILHSEDDLRCPMSQAEQLWVVLKRLRRDVEFVRFPDESHEMSRSGRPSHRVDRFNVILDYFGRKLAEGASRGK
jgi:dipeptidyl aminopeptidase/acylaminoacyl peptidase